MRITNLNATFNNVKKIVKRRPCGSKTQTFITRLRKVVIALKPMCHKIIIK